MSKEVYKTDSRKELMLDALKKTLGIVTTACQKADISRQTHYEWLREDPIYKKKVDEISEMAIDFVETKMFEGVNNNDSGLIKYYLSTKGKNRGYVERQENRQVDGEGKDVKAVQVMIINGKEIEF
jgi:hypothetical protein